MTVEENPNTSKKNTCTVDASFDKPSSRNDSNSHGDHNNTTQNNTLNQTVNNVNLNITCTPEQKDEIVSFIDTDLDAGSNSY
jgi:hypothetical protein